MEMKSVAGAVLVLAVAIACGPTTPSTVPVPPPTPPAAPPPAPPPPPAAGTSRMTANLTTPNSDDAAILLELRGASIHNLALANSSWKMFADSSSPVVRVVITGSLASGALFTFDVPNGSVASSYAATLVDIADRQNKLRGASGYALTIAP